MKKSVGVFLFSAISLALFSQGMSVKKYNLSSFSERKKFTPATLEERSSSKAKQHPEYGFLPLHTQCTNCVELIDHRTADSRLYINPYKPNHTYSQKSFFPLHYKNSEDDFWRTIDFRLQPSSVAGVYTAPNQPVVTKYDLNNQTTSLLTDGFEFEFNRNLSMYFVTAGNAFTKVQQGNYSDYTIGEEGLHASNFWQGINLEQLFKTGEIKTNYVIPSPLTLPVKDGFMVIEDHFSLPQGFTIEEESGKHLQDGSYQGDYIIRNEKGESLIRYEKPVFVDARAYGVHGSYQLEKSGHEYTLKMFVPVEWLSNPNHTYPITIDPIVTGIKKLGNFTKTGLPSAGMGFTTMSLGSCDYHLDSVVVPGMSQLTNAYVDLEYTLTYDPTCGNPPLPAPFCTFSQVTMEVISDTCNQTTGLLWCNPALPPYTGTCTTDPNLVTGASALLINNFNPNYLKCLAPQCPDYELDFTLKNRDSTCGDVCGFLCARGNMWQMTIQACTVEGSISQDKTQICAGEPVTFTAHPNCGVPPYHFYWTKDGGNTYDTVYNSPYYTIYPQADVTVGCFVADTCENLAITNDLSVTVIPSPPANAGADVYMCAGGASAQLGGSPTTSPGASIQWTGENATVQSWLSGLNVPNPVLIVPSGVIDTFFYVLRTSDFTCFRRDTVVVYSNPNPTAVIDTTGSTKLCANQTVSISTTQSFASYQWSNGSTSSSITVNQAGQYYVVVTDQHGCRDTSNFITVTSIVPPTISVYPDTLIMYGDSVMLYTDFNLNSISVDSFVWYPLVNISCTDCPNPVVSPLNNQYYTLLVYTQGCTVADSALIQVILPNNFYIPNAFTPNGDGNNDDFYVLSQSGVKVIMFQVFNRTGEKVHDGTYPWNGIYKGKPAPPGVYVYLFKLGLFGDDRSVFRKGSVTLIR
ncbi:MAG: gliding motility-associated C-terminal domain-containing protein [Chitinophagales bacterium]|nr:gliding motility-associated C-terminal domain-containing protein [Chitinophagales bacterium]